MTAQDTSRRLTFNYLQQDIDSLNGLRTITGYTTTRPEASPDALQNAYDIMIAKQKDETEKEVIFKAASDAAKQAEWNFHNAVLSMKEAIRGQFGSDSDEAQAVGFKKKSERKKPVLNKSKSRVASK